MATAKGRAIADYAASKDGCAYIYGGYGEKLCTPAFRRERANAYPSQKANIYNNCPVLSGKQSTCSGCKWNGKQAYDCAQLTRYACKAGGQALVSGANSQWTKTKWAAKGPIATLPDEPGVILYHSNDSGTMTHTGVYLGGGYAEEARAAKYGVVKTAVRNRTWTHWAALPGVLSEGSTVVSKPTSTPTQTKPTEGKTVVIELNTLRSGSKGEQVKTLQRLLNATGHVCGSSDGIFGVKTVAGVKSFQKAEGIEVDGVVGKDTWTRLLK